MPTQKQQSTGTQLAQALFTGDAEADQSQGLVFVHEDERIKWLAWDQARAAWLESKRNRSGRDNTVSVYKTAVRQFFSWTEDHFGQPLPPWEVNPLVAQEWHNYLNTEKDYAIATVNLKLSALSSFYDYVAHNYVAQDQQGNLISLWPADRANPFQAIDRAKPPRNRARYPTTEELQAILNAINTDCLTGKRDFALLYAFAYTCRRSSELLNLRWGDIEHDPPLPNGNYIYTYTVMKKGKGQRRQATLHRNCYAAICDYLRADDRLDPANDHYPADDDYIFIPLNPQRILRLRPELEGQIEPNSPISNRFANDVLKKYARRAGVDEDKAHLHALRHAGARLRYEQEKASGTFDPLDFQDLLQHENLNTTQGYIKQNFETPEDPGGEAAANALLPTGKPRRWRPAPPEQEEMSL
jgi:integrase